MTDDIDFDGRTADEVSRRLYREQVIGWSIERFKKELRLNDWDIRYDPKWTKKDGKDASSLIDIGATHRIAQVRIDPEVTGDNLDFHIAHELAHLAVYDLYQMLGQTAAKTGPGGEAIIDWLGLEVEKLCNTIAHALTGVLYEPVGKDKKHFAAWVA